MNADLSLKQAIALLDYLKNSSGADRNLSNVELLSGLILLFCRMYLELIITEMEKKK